MFSLAVSLLIPDEAFMGLTLPEKHYLHYSRQTGTQQYLCLSIKLIAFKKLCALDNHRGSDLTDRSTSPVADPLQVGKDLCWNLYVDTAGKVLGVESVATDIFVLINHCLAPKPWILGVRPIQNRQATRRAAALGGTGQATNPKKS